MSDQPTIENSATTTRATGATGATGATSFGSQPASDSQPASYSRPTLPLSAICIQAGRGRKEFSNIRELAEDIAQNGLINAVVVTPIPDKPGQYYLIAGERRLRAAMLLEWKTIPVHIIHDCAPLASKLIELSENVHREALTALEQIELTRQIDELQRKLHGSVHRGPKMDSEPDAAWSLQKTADFVGLPKSQASLHIKTAKFLKSRPDVREKVKHLPLAVMVREIEKIKETELAQARLRSGVIKTHTTFRNCDALTLLKDIPDNSVDLLLTDPPYGNDQIESVRAEGDGDSYHSFIKPTDNLNSKAYVELMSAFIPELKRVMKPGSHCYVFFASEFYPFLVQTLSDEGFLVCPQPLIWYKRALTSRITGYSYISGYEPILMFYSPTPEGTTKRRLVDCISCVFEVKPVPVAKRKHAFEKPAELISKLMKNSTMPGDIVLDPFAGSGVVPAEAKRIGRGFWASELDQDHYAKAARRIDETIKE